MSVSRNFAVLLPSLPRIRANFTSALPEHIRLYVSHRINVNWKDPSLICGLSVCYLLREFSGRIRFLWPRTATHNTAKWWQRSWLFQNHAEWNQPWGFRGFCRENIAPLEQNLRPHYPGSNSGLIPIVNFRWIIQEELTVSSLCGERLAFYPALYMGTTPGFSRGTNGYHLPAAWMPVFVISCNTQLLYGTLNHLILKHEHLITRT